MTSFFHPLLGHREHLSQRSFGYGRPSDDLDVLEKDFASAKAQVHALLEGPRNAAAVYLELRKLWSGIAHRPLPDPPPAGLLEFDFSPDVVEEALATLQLVNMDRPASCSELIEQAEHILIFMETAFNLHSEGQALGSDSWTPLDSLMKVAAESLWFARTTYVPNGGDWSHNPEVYVTSDAETALLARRKREVDSYMAHPSVEDCARLGATLGALCSVAVLESAIQRFERAQPEATPALKTLFRDLGRLADWDAGQIHEVRGGCAPSLEEGEKAKEAVWRAIEGYRLLSSQLPALSGARLLLPAKIFTEEVQKVCIGLAVSHVLAAAQLRPGFLKTGTLERYIELLGIMAGSEARRGPGEIVNGTAEAPEG